MKRDFLEIFYLYNRFDTSLDYDDCPTCGGIQFWMLPGAPRGEAGPIPTAAAAVTGSPSAGAPQTGIPKDVTPVTRVRQQFPEAWIWTESTTGYMN